MQCYNGNNGKDIKVVKIIILPIPVQLMYGLIDAVVGVTNVNASAAKLLTCLRNPVGCDDGRDDGCDEG